jgi:hypothetical protein
MPDTIDINGDEPTSEPVPAAVQPSAPTTAVLIDALHPGAKNYQFKPGDVVPATVLAREGERPDGAIQIVVHNPAFKPDANVRIIEPIHGDPRYRVEVL